MPRRIVRIEVLFTLAAAALPMGFAARGQTPHHPAPGARSGTVLIFPFENGSKDANLDWLGEGLAELTAERLESRGVAVLTRQERLAALEKLGLPGASTFSHATMIKVGGAADADQIVFGSFAFDGKQIALRARVLGLSPLALSEEFEQSAARDELLRAHARLAAQLLCVIERGGCADSNAAARESSFTEPPPTLTLDTFQSFVRGVMAPDDEARLRLLREAARQEPAWDLAAFHVGQIYFERRDCESALPWLSRVPPDRPRGAEASFDGGVCHLIRNDDARAEASFSALIERAHSSDPADTIPELAEARNNLGVARLRLRKWPEAAAEFERATVLDGGEPSYWFNLGLARMAAGDPAAAVDPLQHALSLDANDAEARSVLIAALEAAGRRDDAEARRKEGPESDAAHPLAPVPKDPAALARLARITMRLDPAALRPPAETPAAAQPGSSGAGLRAVTGEQQ